MAEESTQSASEKKKEDWMNSKWRPMMGWMYMLTCMTDFVLFPILWSLLQSILKQPVTQWQPLTLQGAGLFHVAMGAVLGIAAMGRTQEKLAGANNGNSTTANVSPSGSSAFGFSTPSTAPVAGSFGAPVATPTASGFGAGFDAAPAPSAPVLTGFGGKKAPVPSQDPLL